MEETPSPAETLQIRRVLAGMSESALCLGLGVIWG